MRHLLDGDRLAGRPDSLADFLQTIAVVQTVVAMDGVAARIAVVARIAVAALQHTVAARSDVTVGPFPDVIGGCLAVGVVLEIAVAAPEIVGVVGLVVGLAQHKRHSGALLLDFA